jgi:hypothetical protein
MLQKDKRWAISGFSFYLYCHSLLSSISWVTSSYQLWAIRASNQILITSGTKSKAQTARRHSTPSQCSNSVHSSNSGLHSAKPTAGPQQLPQHTTRLALNAYRWTEIEPTLRSTTSATTNVLSQPKPAAKILKLLISKFCKTIFALIVRFHSSPNSELSVSVPKGGWSANDGALDYNLDNDISWFSSIRHFILLQKQKYQETASSGDQSGGHDGQHQHSSVN